MSDGRHARIAAGEILDVDAETSGWLLAVIRERGSAA